MANNHFCDVDVDERVPRKLMYWWSRRDVSSSLTPFYLEFLG